MRDPAAVNTVLSIPDTAGMAAGIYHLRIYRRSDNAVAVVLGDLTDNAGPDVHAALRSLVDVVRREHIRGADRVSWLAYFPYGHTAGAPDRFFLMEPEADEDAATGLARGQEISAGEADGYAGTLVLRYVTADYTSSGVLPSWQAVAGLAELAERLTRAGQPAVTVAEARAIVADMARSLSQMREVVGCLAADVASGQGPRTLAEPLAGQVQANLASGVELTTLAVEGSTEIAPHRPGNPPWPSTKSSALTCQAPPPGRRWGFVTSGCTGQPRTARRRHHRPAPVDARLPGVGSGPNPDATGPGPLARR